MTLPEVLNSSTENHSADPLGRTTVQIGIEISIGIAICLISFLGNVLVVYAIHRDPRLNTITNMLIENLAFSDIFMAVLHMPFWIISLRYGRWIFGHVACQIVGVTQLIFGISSLFTMTGIALNRYFKVVKRNLYLRFFSVRKTTYCVIAFCWLATVIVTTPQLYGWGKIEYHKLFSDCTCVWGLEDISFMLFLCISTIFLAATVTFSCYFVIYRTVKASARRVEGHSSINSDEKGIKSIENKVLKTSFVVVVVYMICWTPLSVIGFIEMFGSTAPRWIHLLAYYLVYCSSLTNPFIYGIWNPQFKQSFATILKIRDPHEARVSTSRAIANSQIDLVRFTAQSKT